MPYGACLIAQSVADAGHDVRLLNLMFEHDPVSRIRRAARQFSPEVVGISFRNIDNNEMNRPEGYAGEQGLMVAFGAGMSVYALLFKKV